MNTTITRLKKFDVFSSLPKIELTNVTKHLVEKRYNRGDIVFREGEPPLFLFLIFSGKVKLYKTSISGKQKIVRVEKEGDILGYRSIFANEEYKASAEVMENTVLGKVEKKVFINIIKKHPDININILSHISRELGDAEEQLMDLVAIPAEVRLAKLLLALNKKFADSKGKLILSRAEVAEMIGTASETVVRILSQFKAQKIVKLKKRQIILLEEQALKELISQYI